MLNLRDSSTTMMNIISLPLLKSNTFFIFYFSLFPTFVGLTLQITQTARNMANLIEEVTFEKEDYSIESLERGDYELCTFINCNFANSDLSNIRFIDCEFHDCNLSAVKLGGTSLQDVRFNNCKMLKSEEHTSELQSRPHLVCRLLLE